MFGKLLEYRISFKPYLPITNSKILYVISATFYRVFYIELQYLGNQ